MSLVAVPLLAAGLCAALRHLLQQRRALHLLQLEHYEDARLFLWLRRRGELIDVRFGAPALIAAAVACALALARTTLAVEALATALVAALQLAAARPELARNEIKPLVYTARAKRILAAAIAPVWVILIAGIVISAVAAGAVAATVALLLILAATAAPAPLTALGNRIVLPWQRRVNARFETAARGHLAAVAPRVIGVTGSYGKTTTKVCIGAVLGAHEPTVVTPASFNSFLGVVRAINENLRPEHRNFVVEMGMYRAGDIAELCELVHPRIGVITAIGPAHLERLGSIEAIQRAKGELAHALPAEGRLIVNGDDPRCVAIAGEVRVATTVYGIENPAASVRAESLRMREGRTLFDLVLGEDRAQIEARLLGRHNVSNLLAAAAVAQAIGIPLDTIRRGLEQVEPPEHRLQPLSTAGGIVVIDDAYNSNPAGAAAALEVLRDHPGQRRILVTPGMVELGEVEAAENERFGALAAEACDHVILVGPTRTVPIRRGLEAAGFQPDRIEVVRDIAGATAALAGLTRAGDVVLFENDLPDMYAEPTSEPPAASAARK